MRPWTGMDANGKHYDWSKVPEVTLVFWILKILATTLGETGGDAVTMSMNLGYSIGTSIFAAIFAVVVTAQIAATRFHPFLFWGVIVATTTAGTTLADLLDRSLGIGYAGGAATLFVLLMVTLATWRWTMGSIAVNRIESRKAEAFYWLTVFFSQTLGTALGDWMADSAGLGYEGGAIVFATGLGVVGVAYYFTKTSRTLLFWAAFILTRPLGATLGDLLDKPHSHGGLELSRYVASAILAGVIVTAVAVLPQRAEKVRRRA
jgi:uncharacterized membrane-anchored protein